MQTKRPTSDLNLFTLLSGFVLAFCFSLNTVLAQPQELLSRADSLSEAFQYEAANAILQGFIQDYPQRKYDLGEAYFKMGRNYFHLEQMETAARCNQQSTDLRMAIAPDALGWNEQLSACIHLAEGQYETALEHLQKARLYPFFDDPLVPAEIALLESEIQEQRQQHDLALKAARSAAEIVEIVESTEAPLLADIYLQQAHLLAAQQDWAATVQACRASLKIEESPGAHLLLGQALLAGKQASEEAKAALAKAQQRGTTAVQIEAGLALAQWELENGKPYGVLAQVDRVSPLINNQQESRGKESGVKKTGKSQSHTIAKLKLLSAQAHLMEASADSYKQALHAAHAGLEACQRSGKEDTLLEAKLLETGLMALTHQEMGAEAFDEQMGFFLDFHPYGDWSFAAVSQNKAADISFIETRSALFGRYADQDTAFVKQLNSDAIQRALSELNTGAPDAINHDTFQQLFGPFETLIANKKELTLRLPPEWPDEEILQLPTTPQPESGIWPFRQQPKPIHKRFKIANALD